MEPFFHDTNGRIDSANVIGVVALSCIAVFWVFENYIFSKGHSKTLTKVEENYGYTKNCNGYTQTSKGRETVVIIKDIVFISIREKGYAVFFEETSGKIGQLFLRYADKMEIIKDVPSGDKAWIQYNGKLFGWDFMEIHVPRDLDLSKFFR